MRRAAVAVTRTAGALGSAVPERLLIAPQDIRTSDPTVASDIYAGHLSLGGRIATTHGASPFEIEPPSALFARELHGFGWLRHLRAADTVLARVNGRALVLDWIERVGDNPHGHAAEPLVAARRLMAWLTQSPLILDGADSAAYQRFIRSLARQARRLATGLPAFETGEQKLFALLALNYFGLCASGMESQLKRWSTQLAETLADQVQPDGGLLSRNPAIIVELLLDLLPLRQGFTARRLAPPEGIVSVVDRLIPMLRMMRHGDGSLALFNGAGSTPADLVAAVLAYDYTQAGAAENAPYTGYQRVTAGDVVLIADTGPPPPPPESARCHAGCLSFEMSVGAHRLIVNCGAPHAGRPQLVQLARATAAHSTLAVADTSSCRFEPPHLAADPDGPLVLAGPRTVPVHRARTAQGTLLVASHDGYGPGFGVVHERQFALGADGSRLEGEDILKPARAGRDLPDHPFAIRFHLHPAVAATVVDGETVLLRLSTGETWQFEAGGRSVALEESVFFAGVDGTRRTLQIVVEARSGESRSVAWAFTRIPRPLV